MRDTVEDKKVLLVKVETFKNVSYSLKKYMRTNDQVDISGHPPLPTGSKQFSDNFGNLLFLAVFNF